MIYVVIDTYKLLGISSNAVQLVNRLKGTAVVTIDCETMLATLKKIPVAEKKKRTEPSPNDKRQTTKAKAK